MHFSIVLLLAAVVSGAPVVDRRADADSATAYKVTRDVLPKEHVYRRSDADSATAYKVTRADADSATAYKVNKREDADSATAYKVGPILGPPNTSQPPPHGTIANITKGHP